MTWAIYPLTNLYNRSALTEFFAVAFLTCSLASFLCVIINTGGKSVSRYDIVATGLFFVMAAVTHPLTALFGGLFLGVLGVMVLIFCEKTRKLWLLAYFSITAFLSFLVLSPWIYVLGQFNSKLPVSSRANLAANFYKYGFFPRSIDNILSRLCLIPLDTRLIKNGCLQDIPCPYLDAQIVMPLVILIVVFIYIGWRKKSKMHYFTECERALICGSAFMLILTLGVSVYPKIFKWLRFFDILQFPYRLTSYVNLSALVILILLAGRIGRINVNSKHIINICLAFCIGISLSALMLKLVHASAVRQRSTKIDQGVINKYQFAEIGLDGENVAQKLIINGWAQPIGLTRIRLTPNLDAAIGRMSEIFDKNFWKILPVLQQTHRGPWAPLPFGSSRFLNELPFSFYGAEYYSVEDGFAKAPLLGTVPVSRQGFDVLEGARFGHVEGLIVNLTQPTLVITNVQPFPWNRIVVDGSLRSQSGIIVADGREAVLLPSGRHSLYAVARTDTIWKDLNLLSWVLLLGWIVLYGVYAFEK